MKTYICMVLVGVLVLCGARPQLKQTTRGQYPHFLSRLVNRNIHHQRRQVATDNCKEMSAAAGAFMREVSHVTSHIISATDISNAFEFYLGDDFVNDHDAREAFYCAITPATSVANLKLRADSQNYNYNLVRFGYDALVVFGISDLMAATNNIPQVSFLNSLGLFSLDPEGTDFLRSLIQRERHNTQVVVPYVPPTHDDFDAKCSELQAMIQQVLQLIDAVPQGASIQEAIYNITGIHTHETDRVNELACKLLEAAPGGLKKVYDVLDCRGVILHFYKTTLYPMFVRMVKWYIETLQMMVTMAESASENSIGGQYPNYGGQYPNYGGQYPNNGGQYPNYGGGPPGGPGMPGPNSPPTAQLQLYILALEYMQQIEASGLLDLH